MKVIVTEAMIDDAIPQDGGLALTQLVLKAFEGRHDFQFTTHAALEKCIALFPKEWRDMRKMQLERVIASNAKRNAGLLTIEVDAVCDSIWDASLPRVTLHDALQLLAEPLTFIVEDVVNDWAFFKKILPAEEREILHEGEARRWIRVVHGGGTRVGAEIERRLRNPVDAINTFAVFDGDRMHPDELDMAWQPANKETRKECHAYKYEQLLNPQYRQHYWRLSRRFIESYMPLQELRIWSEKNRCMLRYEEFLKMTQVQQWHFNMKWGFADDKPNIKLRQGDLYASLTHAQLDALQGGFGEKMAQHYSTATNEFNWDEAARQEADQAIPNLLRLL